MTDRSPTSDEDFDYGNHSDDANEETLGKSTLVTNQPHDEEVTITDSESQLSGGDPHPAHTAEHSRRSGFDLSGNSSQGSQGRQSEVNHSKSSEEQETMEGSSPDGSAATYNAQEFKHLNVSPEVRDLFKYIGRYKAQNIELETKVKPFIPDYIPAVGDIDEFIKVPRPDGKPDFLGLKVLDEPGPLQSDPTILNLKMRQLSKQARTPGMDMDVGCIQHKDDGKDKKINNWIQNIVDLHKKQPPATVMYSKRMPDVETLMEEWPPEVESHLKGMRLPSGDLDVTLEDFAKIVCSILDIPTHNSPVESLHLLFTLYLEFKNNPYLRQNMDPRGSETNILTHSNTDNSNFS
ncbi:hypothetical protein BSKO_03200 [Bryopsis sp. KO-2023]|nr:hypothetical protein BSKO_03200 [Bryopsis sp. KO-2023]